MSDIRIPVFKPYIAADTMEAAFDALRLGWLGMGSYVKEFEQAIATQLGLDQRERQVVAVNTGTSALHLALLVAGVGPGDEVITPSLNNIGDFQAIRMVGADPAFCDVEESTLGIDVNKAAELVSPRTKAIIAVDYDGVPCDWDAVHDLARRRGLRVIHDAAHSFGSRYEGRSIGAFGDIVVFSFDPVKTLTCIDGGALVVSAGDDVERLHRYRLLGMDQKAERMYTNARAWTYDVADCGFRYHLANLHAAIGLSQLRRLNEFVVTRRKACRLYNRLLVGCPGLITPQTDFDDVAAFAYYLRVLDGRRERLIAGLRERGIDSGIHWIPGHRFSFFRDCRRGDLSTIDRVADELLTLPLHSFMPPETVAQVADAVRECLTAAAQPAPAGFAAVGAGA
jgi:dTDP-4-amino-4,6-dideoxygalactose transaminase